MDVVNSSEIIYLVVGASRHTDIAICGGKSKHGGILFVKSQTKHTRTGETSFLPLSHTTLERSYILKYRTGA